MLKPLMANRHLARSVVLQVLFERDSGGDVMSAPEAQERLVSYSNELGVRDSDASFTRQLLQTAIAKQKEVDAVIQRAAPDWTLNKIATIDRNILRIGLTELFFAEQLKVPAKVAINEAIELAKEFGGSSSSRFVNGVLGAVYVELGEPGKNDGSKRHGDKQPDSIPTEELVGAVVFAESDGGYYLAFVHDIFGHWTISKGKLDHGEEIRDGAVRKIKEEMGLDIVIVDEIGVNEYIANDSKIAGGKKRKRVTYFLAQAPFVDIRLGSSGGLDDAQWFPIASVGDLNFYDDSLQKVVLPAIHRLAKLRKQ